MMTVVQVHRNETGEPLTRNRDRAVNTGPSADSLPPVQRDILCLLAAGASDDRVADALGIGLRTVQRHVAGLMELLGARSRFEAGMAAALAGWVRPADGDPRTERYRQARRRLTR